MRADIVEFSLFPNNCYEWLFLVKNDSVWVKTNTKHENGKNILRKSRANILIF